MGHPREPAPGYCGQLPIFLLSLGHRQAAKTGVFVQSLYYIRPGSWSTNSSGYGDQQQPLKSPMSTKDKIGTRESLTKELRKGEET